MITGFDHVVIGVRDLARATTAYETLLGRNATPRNERDGVATALIALGNIAVELMAPEGEGETARRLNAALEDGEGLKSLVFAIDDIERAHHRCERVGLAPEEITAREAQRSFRINSAHTFGIRIFVIERDAVRSVAPASAAAVSDLDHVVIRSANLERAAALYGARLGLDMRLDREVMGRRLMFFRCGDAVVELVEEPAQSAGDRLWGLSWRVADAEAASARLAAAGITVSDVRTGQKPGTRVFTVRDRTFGVPTLMIESSPRRD